MKEKNANIITTLWKLGQHRLSQASLPQCFIFFAVTVRCIYCVLLDHNGLSFMLIISSTCHSA